MTGTAIAEVLPAAGPGGAIAAFEEDPPRGRAGDTEAAPLLHLGAFEGRLDWLLELARGRKVDLARLSLVEIADQLLLALDGVAGERDSTGGGSGSGGAALAHRSEWVVMGAWLVELRSRLLLPEDTAAGRQAHEQAATLRDQLVERARMRAAADWLDAQPQLGRDVFARGAPMIGARRDRTTDLTALLRACLVVLQAEVARGERYRPRPPAIWRVRDAMARIQMLLPTLSDAVPDEASLWQFLPDAECLASAGLAPDRVPDPGRLCRSAVASTLVAGLELARQGQFTLAQEKSFEVINVYAQLEVALAGQ